MQKKQSLILLSQMKLEVFAKITDHLIMASGDLLKVGRHLEQQTQLDFGSDLEKMEATSEQLEKVVRETVVELKELVEYLENRLGN
jgi:hypothetical protein